MKYRKKQVVIDAIQWLGDREELKNWQNQVSNGNPLSALVIGIDEVRIITLEGKMSVSIGDYIIRGVVGEFYPCKPDIFEKTYDAVSDEPVVGSNGGTIESPMPALYNQAQRTIPGEIYTIGSNGIINGDYKEDV